MNDLVVPTCAEPIVALEPATSREIPWPLRLTDWVVELVETKASSVTVADCADALPGRSRSAAAKTASQRIFAYEAMAGLATSAAWLFIVIMVCSYAKSIGQNRCSGGRTLLASSQNRYVSEWRRGQPASIPQASFRPAPKAFETLLLLVENSGHLLTKDELMKRLWPVTFVEEANLAQNISAIRRVLDDKNGE